MAESAILREKSADSLKIINIFRYFPKKELDIHGRVYYDRQAREGNPCAQYAMKQEIASAGR